MPLTGSSAGPGVRWSIEIPHLALLASMFIVSAILWPSLPDRLAVHWTGLPPAIPMRADGFGGKAQALLLCPIIGSAFYVLLLYAPKWSDRYEGMDGTIGFGLLRLAVTALIASMHFSFIAYYKNPAFDLFAFQRDSIAIFGSTWVGCFIWQLFRPHFR